MSVSAVIVSRLRAVSITPLGRPGRPARPDEHREVARRVGLLYGFLLRQPLLEIVEADGDAQRDLADHLGVGGVIDEAVTVEQLQERAVLGGLVAGVDRAPDRPEARDPEHARERARVVGRQDPDLVAGLYAGGLERARNGPAEVLDVPVGQGVVALDQAGRVAAERRAFVQIVDERGHLSRGRSAPA